MDSDVNRNPCFSQGWADCPYASAFVPDSAKGKPRCIQILQIPVVDIPVDCLAFLKEYAKLKFWLVHHLFHFTNQAHFTCVSFSALDYYINLFSQSVTKDFRTWPQCFQQHEEFFQVGLKFALIGDDLPFEETAVNRRFDCDSQGRTEEERLNQLCKMISPHLCTFGDWLIRCCLGNLALAPFFSGYCSMNWDAEAFWAILRMDQERQNSGADVQRAVNPVVAACTVAQASVMATAYTSLFHAPPADGGEARGTRIELSAEHNQTPHWTEQYPHQPPLLTSLFDAHEPITLPRPTPSVNSKIPIEVASAQSLKGDQELKRAQVLTTSPQHLAKPRNTKPRDSNEIKPSPFIRVALPAQYQDRMVKVGGFSQILVSLPRDLQRPKSKSRNERENPTLKRKTASNPNTASMPTKVASVSPPQRRKNSSRSQPQPQTNPQPQPQTNPQPQPQIPNKPSSVSPALSSESSTAEKSASTGNRQIRRRRAYKMAKRQLKANSFALVEYCPTHLRKEYSEETVQTIYQLLTAFRVPGEQEELLERSRGAFNSELEGCLKVNQVNQSTAAINVQVTLKGKWALNFYVCFISRYFRAWFFEFPLSMCSWQRNLLMVYMAEARRFNAWSIHLCCLLLECIALSARALKHVPKILFELKDQDMYAKSILTLAVRITQEPKTWSTVRRNWHSHATQVEKVLHDTEKKVSLINQLCLTFQREKFFETYYPGDEIKWWFKASEVLLQAQATLNFWREVMQGIGSLTSMKDPYVNSVFQDWKAGVSMTEKNGVTVNSQSEWSDLLWLIPAGVLDQHCKCEPSSVITSEDKMFSPCKCGILCTAAGTLPFIGNLRSVCNVAITNLNRTHKKHWKAIMYYHALVWHPLTDCPK